jgi:xylose dehydrogenase (NAD/NADP)
VLPAIAESRNGRLVSIASRDPDRARRMASEHAIPRTAPSYEAVLEDREVDAVYIPLVNSEHREWTLRALSAGKHVLCEKPLAVNAVEAEEMAAAARSSGRRLMEAFMYRFHPRVRALTELLRSGEPPLYVQATFGFPLRDAGNVRLQRALGGGALLDVGCYGVSVARWILGEPDSVLAAAHVGDSSHVDMSVSALLQFPGGAMASVWGSFESAEEQALHVVTRERTFSLAQPFTAWRDPDDPYRLMVESFADSVIGDQPAAISLEESVANMRALDRIRDAAGI